MQIVKRCAQRFADVAGVFLRFLLQQVFQFAGKCGEFGKLGGVFGCRFRCECKPLQPSSHGASSQRRNRLDLCIDRRARPQLQCINGLAGDGGQ